MPTNLQHMPLRICFYIIADRSQTFNDMWRHFLPSLSCHERGWGHHNSRAFCRTVLAKKFIRKVSALILPLEKKYCRTPATVPVLYIDTDTRESALLVSCFFLPTLPMIRTVPSSLAMRQVSSPPVIKCWINSPNYFPVKLQVPVFRRRSSFRAPSYTVCQRYC
jgi:hypothetical protein